MNKIASFTVDHRFINEGVYISRIDGDITTYDMRMEKPNTGSLMDNTTMHSLEHLFATFVRNSEIADDVIYFGPMGCQTGFYLLVRNADNAQVINIIKKTLEDIAVYDGEMPGESEIECGNYRNLSVNAARIKAKAYLEQIKDITVEDLSYSKGGVIGIIGAMPNEVAAIKAKMSFCKTEKIGTIEFNVGELLGANVVVAVAGVGKVNAAICTQTLISKYSPKFIINTGVAGGYSKLKVGEIVVATAVVQHDFDTSPIGDKKGQIGGINIVEIPCSENVAEMITNALDEIKTIPYERGIVATGDQFIGERDKANEITKEFGAIAYEMEGGSIGQVCYINKVDFCVLRSISDNGDEGAAMSYAEFSEIAIKNTVRVIETLLKNI